jgi:hypothetical protein
MFKKFLKIIDKFLTELCREVAGERITGITGINNGGITGIKGIQGCSISIRKER